MLSRLISLSERKPAATNKPAATPQSSHHPFFTPLIANLESLILFVRQEYSLQFGTVTKGKESSVVDPLKNHTQGRMLWEMLQTARVHTMPGALPTLNFEHFSNVIDFVRSATHYDQIKPTLDHFNELIVRDIKTSTSQGGGCLNYCDIDYTAAGTMLKDLIAKDSDKTPVGEMLWRVCLGLKREHGHALVTTNADLIARIRQLSSFQSHEPMNDRAFSTLAIENPWLFAFFTKKRLIDFFLGCSEDSIAALKRHQDLHPSHDYSDEACDIGKSLFSPSSVETSGKMSFPTLSRQELNKKVLVRFLMDSAVVVYTRNVLNDTVASREFVVINGFHREFIPVLLPSVITRLFSVLDSHALKKAEELKETADRNGVTIQMNASHIRGFIQYGWLLTRIEKDLSSGTDPQAYFNKNKEEKKIPYLLYELLLRGTLLQFSLPTLLSVFKAAAPDLILETLQLLDPDDVVHRFIEIGEINEKYEVDKSNTISFARLRQLLLSDDFQGVRQAWAEDPCATELLQTYPVLLKGVTYLKMQQFMAVHQRTVLLNAEACIDEECQPFVTCPLLLAYLAPNALKVMFNESQSVRQLFTDRMLPAEAVIHFLKNINFEEISAKIPELLDYLTADFFSKINKELLDEQLLRRMVTFESTRTALERYPAMVDAFNSETVSAYAKDSVFLSRMVRRNTAIKLILTKDVTFKALHQFMWSEDPIALIGNAAIFTDAHQPFVICPLLLAFLSPDELVKKYGESKPIRQLFIDRTLPAEVLIHIIKTGQFVRILASIPELQDYLNLEFFRTVSKQSLDEPLLSAMLANEETKKVLKRYPSILQAFTPGAVSACARDSSFLRQVVRQYDLIALIRSDFDQLMSQIYVLKEMVKCLYLNPESEAILLRIDGELNSRRELLYQHYNFKAAIDHSISMHFGALKKMLVDVPDLDPESLAKVQTIEDELKANREEIFSQYDSKKAFDDLLAAYFGLMEKMIEMVLSLNPASEEQVKKIIAELKSMIEEIQYETNLIDIGKKKLVFTAKPYTSGSDFHEHPSQQHIDDILENLLIIEKVPKDQMAELLIIMNADPLVWLIELMIQTYPHWASRFIQSPGFYPVLHQYCIKILRDVSNNITRNSDYYSVLYEHAALFITIEEYENAARLLMEYLFYFGVNDVAVNKAKPSAFHLLLTCADRLVEVAPSDEIEKDDEGKEVQRNKLALGYYIFAGERLLDAETIPSLTSVKKPSAIQVMSAKLLMTLEFAKKSIVLMRRENLPKDESLQLLSLLHKLLLERVQLVNHLSPDILLQATEHQNVLASFYALIRPDESKVRQRLSLLQDDPELRAIFDKIKKRQNNNALEDTSASHEKRLIVPRKAIAFSVPTRSTIEKELEALRLNLGLAKRKFPKKKAKVAVPIVEEGNNLAVEPITDQPAIDDELRRAEEALHEQEERELELVKLQLELEAEEARLTQERLALEQEIERNAREKREEEERRKKEAEDARKEQERVALQQKLEREAQEKREAEERRRKETEDARKKEELELQKKREEEALELRKRTEEENKRKKAAEDARKEQERLERQQKLEREEQEKKQAEERRKKEIEDARQKKLAAEQKLLEEERRKAEERKRGETIATSPVHSAGFFANKSSTVEEVKRKESATGSVEQSRLEKASLMIRKLELSKAVEAETLAEAESPRTGDEKSKKADRRRSMSLSRTYQPVTVSKQDSQTDTANTPAAPTSAAIRKNG